MIRKGKKAVLQVYFFLCWLRACISIPVSFSRACRSGVLSYLSAQDLSVWKNAMLDMIRESCFHTLVHREKIVQTFSRARIDVIRKTDAPPKDNPIVVLCVRNDLRRLQMLVYHYRKLGIDIISVMDNGSTDGTFEWCLDQADLDLYRCTEPYGTLVKEGWINRIISHYGFNRWYILADSDELLIYKGMETHPVKDLIRYAEEHHLRRIRGLTLDTYSNGPLFEKAQDINENFRWIDTDSYRETDLPTGSTVIRSVVGGPRYRLMGSDVSLSKFPLVFFEPGTVSETAHYQFPFSSFSSSPYHVGILHYKFLEGDSAEYRSRMEAKRGFASNGKHYKKYFEYIDQHDGATFMYEGSREFTDSGILDEISVIDPIAL